MQLNWYNVLMLMQHVVHYAFIYIKAQNKRYHIVKCDAKVA